MKKLLYIYLFVILFLSVHMCARVNMDTTVDVAQLLRKGGCRGCLLIASDLSVQELANADLRDAQLNAADLIATNLNYANLTRANISNARLTYCSLNQAILNEANMVEANFDYATLIKADCRDCKGYGATFMETLATDVNFFFAQLESTDFQNSILNLAIFQNANLRNSRMQRISAVRANFRSADLTGTQFDHSWLDSSNFSNAIVLTADFRRASLVHTVFNEANLQEVNLRLVDAKFADFSKADMRNTRCMEGDFSQAIFTGARLDNANFTRAKLVGAKDFDRNAPGLILCETIMPDGSVVTRNCEEQKTLLKFLDAEIERAVANKLKGLQEEKEVQKPAAPVPTVPVPAVAK